VRQHLIAVEAEPHLLADFLTQGDRRRALQMVAGMHREAAAALAGFGVADAETSVKERVGVRVQANHPVSTISERTLVERDTETERHFLR